MSDKEVNEKHQHLMYLLFKLNQIVEFEKTGESEYPVSEEDLQSKNRIATESHYLLVELYLINNERFIEFITEVRREVATELLLRAKETMLNDDQFRKCELIDKRAREMEEYWEFEESQTIKELMSCERS